MRKGFTLVELLIVIVVIGVLATMMLFSSSEAVLSARVNNIITTLRDLRTAALAWHTDHPHSDFVSAKYNGGDKEKWNDIVSYLKNKADTSELKNYYFQSYGYNSDREFLYVEYKIEGSNSEEIKRRLAGRAKLEGLLQAAYGGEADSNSDPSGNITGDDISNKEKLFDGKTNLVLYRVY